MLAHQVHVRLPVGNPKKTLQAGELGKTRIADHLAVRRRTDALMVLATAAPTQVQIFTRRRNRPDDDEYDQWGVQPPSDHYADKARSEERRVGKEGVSKWRSRWSPYP